MLSVCTVLLSFSSRFQYQISVSSTASDTAGNAALGDLNLAATNDDDGTVIYLGDDQPVHIKPKAQQKEPSLLKPLPSVQQKYVACCCCGTP